MFNRRTRVTGGWLLATLFALSAAYSASGNAEEHVITIQRMKFRTPDLTVKVGDTVTWKNNEYRQYHNVWFENSGEPEPVDYFYPQERYSRTFSEVGTFYYRCGPHEKMTGVIHVVE